MSGYAASIIEATGCKPEDVEQVEEIMRASMPTLDHLTKREFNSLARSAAEALPILRSEGMYL
jgi:hypothetical protein